MAVPYRVTNLKCGDFEQPKVADGRKLRSDENRPRNSVCNLEFVGGRFSTFESLAGGVKLATLGQ
jgi:hypothetical protein